MSNMTTVFTDTSEFHLHNGRCIAVRSAQGDWVTTHPALNNDVSDDCAIDEFSGRTPRSTEIRLMFSNPDFISNPVQYTLRTTERRRSAEKKRKTNSTLSDATFIKMVD